MGTLNLDQKRFVAFCCIIQLAGYNPKTQKNRKNELKTKIIKNSNDANLQIVVYDNKLTKNLSDSNEFSLSDSNEFSKSLELVSYKNKTNKSLIGSNEFNKTLQVVDYNHNNIRLDTNKANKSLNGSNEFNKNLQVVDYNNKTTKNINLPKKKQNMTCDINCNRQIELNVHSDEVDVVFEGYEVKKNIVITESNSSEAIELLSAVTSKVSRYFDKCIIVCKKIIELPIIELPIELPIIELPENAIISQKNNSDVELISKNIKSQNFTDDIVIPNTEQTIVRNQSASNETSTFNETNTNFNSTFTLHNILKSFGKFSTDYISCRELLFERSKSLKDDYYEDEEKSFKFKFYSDYDDDEEDYEDYSASDSKSYKSYSKSSTSDSESSDYDDDEEDYDDYSASDSESSDYDDNEEDYDDYSASDSKSSNYDEEYEGQEVSAKHASYKEGSDIFDLQIEEDQYMARKKKEQQARKETILALATNPKEILSLERFHQRSKILEIKNDVAKEVQRIKNRGDFKHLNEEYKFLTNEERIDFLETEMPNYKAFRNDPSFYDECEAKIPTDDIPKELFTDALPCTNYLQFYESKREERCAEKKRKKFARKKKSGRKSFHISPLFHTSSLFDTNFTTNTTNIFNDSSFTDPIPPLNFTAYMTKNATTAWYKPYINSVKNKYGRLKNITVDKYGRIKNITIELLQSSEKIKDLKSYITSSVGEVKSYFDEVRYTGKSSLINNEENRISKPINTTVNILDQIANIAIFGVREYFEIDLTFKNFRKNLGKNTHSLARKAAKKLRKKAEAAVQDAIKDAFKRYFF